MFYLTEDTPSNILLLGSDNETPPDYPLNFTFSVSDLDKEIFEIMPNRTQRYNDSAAYINFTPTESYGENSSAR